MVVLIFAATGCATGPRELSRIRQPYNEAVQRTGSEQMLLNLVRLKYRDPPEFLAVTAIADQTVLDGGVDVGATIPEAGFLGLGVGSFLNYGKRPTFSISPLTGAEFQRGLREPISLSTLALLTQSGWGSDRVQRMVIKKINGIDNASSAGGPTPELKPDFEKFQHMAFLLRSLQQRQLVELAPRHRKDVLASDLSFDQITNEEVMFATQQGYSLVEIDGRPGGFEFSKQVDDLALWFHPDAWNTPEAQELAFLLQVSPGARNYVIKSASLEEGQLALFWNRPAEAWQELLITQRSVLEIMNYLSQAVPAPIEHINQGKVTITRDAEGNVFDWNRLTDGLFRVCVSEKRPPAGVASVAVPYEGYWFYIAGNDLTSRATFSLLQEIYNIEVRGGDKGIPFIIGS